MNENVKIPNDVIDLIKNFEGFMGTAYLCPAGVWTIGYGTTYGVKKGDEITEAEATQRLLDWFKTPSQSIKKAIKVPISDNEFGAIMSLVYNVGVGAILKSTLLKKLNANDKTGASNEFLRWDKIRVNGKLQSSNGLAKRRKVEKMVFDGGDAKKAYDSIYRKPK